MTDIPDSTNPATVAPCARSSTHEGERFMSAIPQSDCAKCLLEREASIIAEDDTHMVIALRISKAAVLRNHRFLYCLSESASDTTSPVEP
jgi:hypothetical protein